MSWPRNIPREARRLINENPDLLGIRLAADKSSVGRWRVEGHKGGGSTRAARGHKR
jgi:hypothetical protein